VLLELLKLQWGHGEFAVDDFLIQKMMTDEARRASMGPRRIRRG